MRIEPPYPTIAELLREGGVVPFLGAGVNATIDQAEWDEANPTSLPTGSVLSRLLAKDAQFPSDDERDRTDLAKVSSYYVGAIARRRLRERLRRVFDRPYQPREIHRYLADNPPPLIVTTNYDDLLEEAFRAAGRPFDLVVHPTDRKDIEASILWWKHGEDQPRAVPPKKLYVDLSSTSVIYKMHGSVSRVAPQWDSYVITEEDYVNFLSRMTNGTAVPPIFMEHFRGRHFLFLGYGLRDWNFRVILKNLQTLLPPKRRKKDALGDYGPGFDAGEEFEDLKSWAIQRMPSPHELALWQQRQVLIYDVGVEEFTQRLREHSQ
jgi:hypothetical protein